MDGQYVTYAGSGPGAKQMTVWFDFMSDTRHWELEPYFDVDGGTHVAVVLEDDPGGDLYDTTGRFYYADVETISASMLQAGHQYALRQRVLPTSIAGASADPDPLVFIRYQHLDRFVVEAVATCGQPGIGVPVAIPQVQVPT